MPNHVTTIITVNDDDKHAIQVLLNTNGNIDFNNLIPMPKSLENFKGQVNISAIYYLELKRYIKARNKNCPKKEMITMQFKNNKIALAPKQSIEQKNTTFTALEIENIIGDFLTQAQKRPNHYTHTHNELTQDDCDFFKKSFVNEVASLSLTGTFCALEWAIKHWGTKWNAYKSQMNDTGNSIRFDSAWETPEPVIKTLSKKFPTVVFTVAYADDDLGYNCATYKIQDGEMFDVVDESLMGEQSKDFASNIKYGKSYAMLQAEWEAEEADFEAEQ